MPLYSLDDPREDAELATIDALLESGLICVFSKTTHVEVRGYGPTARIPVSPSEIGERFTRRTAIRFVQRVVREHKEKIREREREHGKVRHD